MKNLLRIEKGVNKADQERIQALEGDLKESMESHEKDSLEKQERINALEIAVKEKERELELTTKKYKEVKAHKKFLKEEVVSRMEEAK